MNKITNISTGKSEMVSDEQLQALRSNKLLRDLYRVQPGERVEEPKEVTDLKNQLSDKKPTRKKKKED